VSRRTTEKKKKKGKKEWLRMIHILERLWWKKKEMKIME
jgi:hypothetical protein